MGSSNSHEFMKYIEAGDEVNAMKHMSKLVVDEKYVLPLLINKKLYLVIEQWLRKKHVDNSMLKTITDVKFMQMFGHHHRGRNYSFPCPASFANHEMLCIYIGSLTYSRVYIAHEFNDTNRDLFERCIPLFETLDSKTIQYCSNEANHDYVKTTMTRLMAARRDANALTLIDRMVNACHHNEASGYLNEFMNYRYVHNGETMVMVALRLGYPWVAINMMSNVDIKAEHKGRNVLHYAFGHHDVIRDIMFRNHGFSWDIEFVTTNLETMKLFMKHWPFKRVHFVAIFTRMIQLPDADDETLRTFFTMIQDYISTVDIPGLMKLTSKFPLTHDRLGAIIKPSSLEAEVMTLKALLQASAVPVVAAAPPPYNPDA